MSIYDDFEHELQKLVNKYSLELPSNIPGYVIASHLTYCLVMLHKATTQRDKFFGITIENMKARMK